MEAYWLLFLLLISLILGFFLWRKKSLSLILGLLLEEILLGVNAFYLHYRVDVLLFLTFNTFYVLLAYGFYFKIRKKQIHQSKEDFSFVFFGVFIAIIYASVSYFFKLQSEQKILEKTASIFFFINVLPYSLRLKSVAHFWRFHLNIHFEDLVNIVKSRTVCFLRKKLFFDGNYKIKKLSHSPALSDKKVHGAFHTLFDKLYPEIISLFQSEEKLPIQFAKQKSSTYIKAKDMDDNLFELGVPSFFPGKITRSFYHYFLFKNEKLVASVQFDTNEKEEDYNQVNYFNKKQYNTALINNALACDTEDYVKNIFDKVYHKNEDEEITSLLKQLDEKAPTLYIYKENGEIYISKVKDDFKKSYGSLKELINEFENYRNYYRLFTLINRTALSLQFGVILCLVFSSFFPIYCFITYSALLLMESLVYIQMRKIDFFMKKNE